MSEKLKPCPFCGSRAMIFKTFNGACYVQCCVCGIGTLHCDDKEQLIKTWNRRTKNDKV